MYLKKKTMNDRDDHPLEQNDGFVISVDNAQAMHTHSAHVSVRLFAHAIMFNLFLVLFLTYTTYLEMALVYSLLLNIIVYLMIFLFIVQVHR